jgi:autophagy-related protein 9
MTSNLLSRFLPPAGSASIYEAIRQDDEASDASDVEERAGMALDEENLRLSLHDYDVEDAMAHPADSQVTTQSTALLTQRRSRKSTGSRFLRTGANAGRSITRPRWMQPSPQVLEADENDDDVPATLLEEGGDDEDFQKPLAPPPHHTGGPGFAEPGPSSRALQDQWDAVKARQPLHTRTSRSTSARRRMPGGTLPNLATVSLKDKALWRWTNVENLDNFLKDVYVYFLGNGIWCIMLSRALNIL